MSEIKEQEKTKSFSRNEFNFFFKRVLLNKFFGHYSFSVFFTFGALLVFEKTGSVIAALVFFLLLTFAKFISRTIGLRVYTSIAGKIGAFWTMALGILISSLISFLIFFIELDSVTSLAIFYLLPIILGFWRPFYTNVANALYYVAVGSSKWPGGSSSKLLIAEITSTILAVFTGFLLNQLDNFLFLFILQGVLFTFSMLPLRGVYLPSVKPMSLSLGFKRLSKKLIFANINPDHELRVTALPLIIAVFFGSIDTSIIVVSLVVLVNAFISYVAGKLKDKKSKTLSVIAALAISLSWVVYGFASTEFLFVVLGIIQSLFTVVIQIGRQARMSREVVNAGNGWESTVAIEAARSFGAFLSILIMVIIYYFTHSLPQTLLITGAFWILPMAYYAIGEVDEVKRASSFTRVE